MLSHLMGVVALAAPIQTSPIQTPYASHEALALSAVTGPDTAAQYAVEELTVDSHGTFDNPFDATDVSLDATVFTPSHETLHIPGFFYRSYTRRLENNAEKLDPAASTGWRVRICPTEPGPYKVSVRFKDRSGFAVKDFSFTATATSDHGFVAVSKPDRHYFAFQDGATYFPIGANVCWASPKGTYDYDDWLSKYAENGCNYFRLWLAPAWTTLALEKAGKESDGAGMGQFDLGDAWRLDQVLNLASQKGLYAMLCIDSYNELRDRDAANYWEHTPQNVDNGGPIRIWSDFWTSPAMDRLYQSKLRYLVARYSAYTHVFAWEFWNEVDLVRDFNPDLVREWHQHMGGSLRALDPYHHLMATSFSDSQGQRSIDLLNEMDFDQTHFYGPNLVGAISNQVSRKTGWGKPNYVGEVGADGKGGRTKDDPDGVQVHDPLWVSMATGTAGGAMPWWWDSLVEPNNLYPLFGALSRFTKGVDFGSEGFRPADSTLAFSDQHANPRPGKPPLAVWTLVGNDMALGWICQAGRNWQKMVDKQIPPPVAATTLTVPGLAMGKWKAEIWDTWSGQVQSSAQINVTLDGFARVTLPVIVSDVAVKLTRIPG